MKRIGIFTLIFVVVNLAWMGFVREPLPEVPEMLTPISPPVNMKFAINTMSSSGVEMSMNNRSTGKGMFVQFKMSNAWKTGRTGLVVTGINSNSNFSRGMSPRAYVNSPTRKRQTAKDFTHFMKDKQGKTIGSYPINHRLVRAKGGQTYLQLTYKGSAMEMLQTLEVPQPITVPAHISRRFVPKGAIQFQRGTVRFDRRINGFNIPVKIRQTSTF